MTLSGKQGRQSGVGDRRGQITGRTRCLGTAALLATAVAPAPLRPISLDGAMSTRRFSHRRHGTLLPHTRSNFLTMRLRQFLPAPLKTGFLHAPGRWWRPSRLTLAFVPVSPTSRAISAGQGMELEQDFLPVAELKCRPRAHPGTFGRGGSTACLHVQRRPGCSVHAV